MYKRTWRRRIRRFRNRLPVYAFFLAVFSFIMAFALPPEGINSPEMDDPFQSVTASPLAAAQPEQVLPAEPDSSPEADVLDKSAWNLTLTNRWNPLPQDYTFVSKALTNGLEVDVCCYQDLQDMLAACRTAGLTPVVCSAYRSYEKQEQLLQNKVERLISCGYSREAAETEAAREVAAPGTSEHQLGLAVDVVDIDNQNLDESLEDTAVQKWLMAHSWEYGFILRYPSEKSELTGIIYEPWHYRYVGRAAAAEIHEQGICLEEYLT